ncbi:MAG: glycoside hydrolase family 3 protein [Bacteroidetes bacterium]|nr:glycoside hydrolase family 3 protein [Bacteroidota bacterium]
MLKNIPFLCLNLIIGFSCWAQQPAGSVSITAPSVGNASLKEEPIHVSAEGFSLDKKIGQMVLIGLDGNAFLKGDKLLKEIKEGKVGGVVLYEKNIAPAYSKVTLQKLIADMQEKSEIPLFISIDEEGGKVHRLKEKYGFFSMVSAAYLGKLDNRDSTYFYNLKLAGLLKELGINLNYAPTIDVALNKDNPVIAKIERSFSADPDLVTKHAKACIDAHHAHGVKTIIKHFPGHGSSAHDTHLGIANVTNQWKIIELMPFRDVIQSGKADAVMTAHIVNCHLDLDCLPATLSKTVITGMLRNLLQFNGVVFSDDMQMHAISQQYGTEKAVKMAIEAGVDVIMFANNVGKERISASEVHSIIRKLVDNGEISEERINESFERIQVLKNKKVN